MNKTKRSQTIHHRLSCRHIRLIDIRRIEVVEGETKVYCRRCDTFQRVLHRADRFESSRD